MTTTLFRPEAIAHQQEVKMGVALSVRTQSLVWITAGFVVLVVAVLCLLGFGEFTRKAHVTGFLFPNQGMLKIYAPQEGTIVEKHVTEGQSVQQGDILFVLSSERASPENADAQAAAIANITDRRDSLLQELEAQDEQQRMHWEEMQERIWALQNELQQMDRTIEVQSKRSDVARDALEKFRTLYEQQYIAEIHWQQKQDDLLTRQAELQSLQRERMDLQRELDTQRIRLQASRYDFARQRAELDRMISSHEQQITEYQARRRVLVRAPRAGVVTTILVSSGQYAKSDAPLVSVLPEGAELEAHLLVPSRSVGFLKQGQQVDLRYQPYPYQRFGSQEGEIKEISRTLIQPGEVDLPVALTEPAYRVVVSLRRQTVVAEHQAHPLQAGMVLDADIRLDKRSLIRWALDPVYRLTGTL